MHRVTFVATGGLDSLPHNGAVITFYRASIPDHQRS
jgi:hypothetical protein